MYVYIYDVDLCEGWCVFNLKELVSLVECDCVCLVINGMFFLVMLLDSFWIFMFFIMDLLCVWIVVFFNVSYFIKEKDCIVYLCLVCIKLFIE